MFGNPISGQYKYIGLHILRNLFVKQILSFIFQEQLVPH